MELCLDIIVRILVFTIPTLAILRHFRTQRRRILFLTVPALVLGFNYLVGVGIFSEIQYLYGKRIIDSTNKNDVIVVGSSLPSDHFSETSLYYDSASGKLTGTIMVQNRFSKSIYLARNVKFMTKGWMFELYTEMERGFTKIEPGSIVTLEVNMAAGNTVPGIMDLVANYARERKFYSTQLAYNHEDEIFQTAVYKSG